MRVGLETRVKAGPQQVMGARRFLALEFHLQYHQEVGLVYKKVMFSHMHL